MLIQQYLDKMDFIPKNVNLDSLNTLIKKHIQLFAFSSINVLLDKELSLEKTSLFKRVISEETGGYCFEHNKIFNLVLNELGYEVRTLMARIVLGTNLNNSRTHRINIVTIDNQDYLVDVGFGPLGPAGAILVDSNFPTKLNSNSYNIVVKKSEYHVKLNKSSETPLTLYVFDKARYTEKDCDQGHFYSHKHPCAIFVNNLVVSKIMDNRIIHILNREFHIEEGTNIETHEIKNQAQLSYILKDEFNMTLDPNQIEILFQKSKKLSKKINITKNL